jgi:hypothetical protein
MTLAIVCGMWQCITVLTALLQDDVNEDVVFVIDLAEESLHLIEPITSLVRMQFSDSVIHVIRDERPRNILMFLDRTVRLLRFGFHRAEKIYFAYFTYTVNHILSMARADSILVLADDGDAHYNGMNFVDSSGRYTPTKHLVDRFLCGYCTSRVHGTTHSRFVRRVTYHHLLDKHHVPTGVFSTTLQVQRKILFAVLGCCYDGLVSDTIHILDCVKFIVLGCNFNLREKNSELANYALEAPKGTVLFKPHPRDSFSYGALVTNEVLLPNYVPIETVVIRHPSVILVDNGSSAIVQCQTLFGVTSVSIDQFLHELRGSNEC